MSNIVALVGRPNVGKSTLYNRLVDSDKSITDSTSGTTRDRKYGIVTWNGITFTTIDTGGYITDSQDIFSDKIKRQISIALAEAQLILFLLDAQAGVTPQDIEFARIIRSTKKKILPIANKADNVKISWQASDFYSLGFGTPLSVSAITGAGTGDLLDNIVNLLPSQNVQIEDKSVIPRVAFLGRPNVGKSSLLNALVGEERCVTSSMPGTTRDSIDTEYKLYNKNIILTDTAGIRKKNKEKDKVEFYSVMRSINAMQNSHICCIIIDAEKGMQAQDLSLLSLAYKYRKGVMILVNKWDLIEKQTNLAKEYTERILEKILPIYDIQIIFISALAKQRIYRVITLAEELYNKLNTRIPTPSLNDLLLPIIEKCPPPAIKGKYVKIKYITQMPTKSITIAFFCNLPQYVKSPYKMFLEKQIRKNFDLTGIPINILLKKK